LKNKSMVDISLCVFIVWHDTDTDTCDDIQLYHFSNYNWCWLVGVPVGAS